MSIKGVHILKQRIFDFSKKKDEQVLIISLNYTNMLRFLVFSEFTDQNKKDQIKLIADMNFWVDSKISFLESYLQELYIDP